MEQILIHTELTYKMAKYKEVQYRLGTAAMLAIKNSIGVDTFLAGAYLRMIVDAAAHLFLVNCMNDSLKDKFLDYWMSGREVSKFKVKINGEWEKLTTGFIRRNNKEFDRLYKALNPLIHPSKDYLDLIYKEEGSKVFLDMEVPKEKVDDMGAINLFYYELEKFDKALESIEPRSTEYRELSYLDSMRVYKGEQPLLIRIYKY